MRTCGTRSAYVAGCRCEDCRAANRAYQGRRGRYGWSDRVAADWCDADDARRHIARLRNQGMGMRRIADLAGVDRSALQAIVYGKHGTPAVRILRRNSDAILAVRPDPAPGANVDPTGTVRRIRALQAMGWSLRHIADRMGWSFSNLGTLASGRRGCTRATADLVAKVYDDLSMTPGPSSRARSLAKSRGWLPPLAWDDDLIDHPDHYPGRGEPDPVDPVAVERALDGDPATLTERERAEVIRLGTERGLSARQIAALVGVNPRTVERARSAA